MAWEKEKEMLSEFQHNLILERAGSLNSFPLQKILQESRRFERCKIYS